MMSRRRFIASLCATTMALAACGLPGSAPAKPKTSTVVTVGFGSLGLGNAPVWVAAEGGYFERYGLNVKTQYLDPAAVLPALASHDVTFSGSAAGSDIPAQLQNASIKIIAAYIHFPTPALLTQPEIKDASGLRGKKFAVAGGTAEFLTKLSLSKLGLEPGKDIELPRVANGKALLASLENKTVEGAILSDPDWRVAVTEGYTLLARLRDLNISYEQQTLIGDRDYMRSNPDVTVSFLKGMNDGLKRFKEDRDFTKKVVDKYLESSPLSPELFDQSYRDAEATWGNTLSLNLAGITTVIEGLGANAKAEDFVDTSYLAQLK